MTKPYPCVTFADLEDILPERCWEPSPGLNTFRILPNRQPNGSFGGQPWFEYRIHRYLGPTRNWYARCGKTVGMQGECFICDRVASLSAVGSVPAIVAQVSFHKESGGKSSFSRPFAWHPAFLGSESLFPQVMEAYRKARIDWWNPRYGLDLSLVRLGEGVDTLYEKVIPGSEPRRIANRVSNKIQRLSELAYPLNTEWMEYALSNTPNLAS